MARRKLGTKARQMPGRDFAQQSEAKSDFALSAQRGMAGRAGNTGAPEIAGAYANRKAVRGKPLNFARRGRRPLGQKQAPKDGPQRPFASDRQYQGNALAMTR